MDNCREIRQFSTFKLFRQTGRTTAQLYKMLRHVAIKYQQNDKRNGKQVIYNVLIVGLTHRHCLQLRDMLFDILKVSKADSEILNLYIRWNGLTSTLIYKYCWFVVYFKFAPEYQLRWGKEFDEIMIDHAVTEIELAKKYGGLPNPHVNCRCHGGMVL
jgi:hypothetical protein